MRATRAVAHLTDVEAVLFDMDGTLVVSHAAVERAWTSWALEYGVEPRAVLAIAHGSPAVRTVREVLPHLDEVAAEAAARHQHELQYDDLDDVVAAPGALALLAVVEDRGVPWAVVTSADRRLAAARLGAAGIAPLVLVTVEDVSAGKPDPEGYLAAARLVGADPTRCVVVEDAAVGVEAGRRSGAITVGIGVHDADVVVADLVELAEMIRGS